VTLSNPWSSTVTVNYATANGTASAGSDYVAKSGTLTFAAGVTSQTISITVNGDTTKEANETFNVNLSSPVNATLGTATGVVTIVNDDGAPLLAATGAPAGASPAQLTEAELAATVSEAERAWLAADPAANFSGVSFAIGDLEGRMLGVTGIGAITIDPTGAGWGWTTDGGSMDLRTVVLHELGHALGLDHDDDGLMAATLAPGVALGLAGRAQPATTAATTSGFAAPVAGIASTTLATIVAAPRSSIGCSRSAVLRPTVSAPLSPAQRRKHRRSG
jgi:hypothetical protein